MGTIIGVVILSILATACFVFSYLQFHEKGYLFNNAYIYASKEERETMNKKPHYRQSGIVFMLLGILFVINAVEIIIKTGWLLYGVIVVGIVAIVYAIVSSVIIERNKK